MRPMRHGAAEENKMDHQVKEAMQRVAQRARPQADAPQSDAAVVVAHIKSQSEMHKSEATNAAREMLRANARRY
jgi:hypothetical protein